MGRAEHLDLLVAEDEDVKAVIYKEVLEIFSHTEETPSLDGLLLATI